MRASVSITGSLEDAFNEWTEATARRLTDVTESAAKWEGVIDAFAHGATIRSKQGWLCIVNNRRHASGLRCATV